MKHLFLFSIAILSLLSVGTTDEFITNREGVSDNKTTKFDPVADESIIDDMGSQEREERSEFAEFAPVTEDKLLRVTDGRSNGEEVAAPQHSMVNMEMVDEAEVDRMVTNSAGGRRGTGTALIIGSVCGGLVAAALCVAGLVWRIRKKRGKKEVEVVV